MINTLRAGRGMVVSSHHLAAQAGPAGAARRRQRDRGDGRRGGDRLGRVPAHERHRRRRLLADLHPRRPPAGGDQRHRPRRRGHRPGLVPGARLRRDPDPRAARRQHRRRHRLRLAGGARDQRAMGRQAAARPAARRRHPLRRTRRAGDRAALRRRRRQGGPDGRRARLARPVRARRPDAPSRATRSASRPWPRPCAGSPPSASTASTAAGSPAASPPTWRAPAARLPWPTWRRTRRSSATRSR